jgi:glucose uptake protein GlcU
MDQVVIGLYALLMVVVGFYVVRFQSRSGRIVPERMFPGWWLA